MVARLGGDGEFTVILTVVFRAEAMRAAQKMIDTPRAPALRQTLGCKQLVSRAPALVLRQTFDRITVEG
jgi:GGDEF domain-containing protein